MSRRLSWLHCNLNLDGNTTQHTQGGLRADTAPLKAKAAAPEKEGEEEVNSGSVTLCVYATCLGLWSMVFGLWSLVFALRTSVCLAHEPAGGSTLRGIFDQALCGTGGVIPNYCRRLGNLGVIMQAVLPSSARRRPVLLLMPLPPLVLPVPREQVAALEEREGQDEVALEAVRPCVGRDLHGSLFRRTRRGLRGVRHRLDRVGCEFLLVLGVQGMGSMGGFRLQMLCVVF